jgi:hypothetical protein
MTESRKWHRLVSSAVVLMLLAACSSDDGDISSDTAAPTTTAPASTASTTASTDGSDTDTTDTSAPDAASPDTTTPGSGPSGTTPDTTEAPSAGGQVIPAGLDMTGTGPSPAGLLTQEAVDQDTCNANGRTTFNIVGGGPFCVNPWSDGSDNGGATATGVTATEVKVIAYIPNAQMLAAGTGAAPPVNQATGETATPADSVNDTLELYDYAVEQFGAFQLWGRQPIIEIVEASGSDETAQRADALAVIDKQPFIVADLVGTATGGSPVFAAAVAAQGIVVASASTTSAIGAEQSPYRWNYASDADATPILAAAFLGKTLSGGLAQYAGDDALITQPRAFGVVYPSTDFDLGGFEAALAASGGDPVAEAVEFDPTDPAKIGEQAPTMINRLKASGVTSVVLFANNAALTPLMAAATAQDYFPEWIYTGFAYQDFDGFARNNDQEQMRHAFGISALFPYVDSGDGYDYLTPFTWYWGTQAGNNWAITGGVADFVYRGMHYAGPDLTAENFKLGLFSAPAQGGAATGTVVYQTGYGQTPGMPYDVYAQLGTDVALAWWNADLEGPSQVVGLEGLGKFVYLNEGKRYSYATLPDEEPVYFDMATSVGEVDISAQFASGEIPEAAPCEGCPAGG